MNAFFLELPTENPASKTSRIPEIIENPPIYMQDRHTWNILNGFYGKTKPLDSPKFPKTKKESPQNGLKWNGSQWAFLSKPGPDLQSLQNTVRSNRSENNVSDNNTSIMATASKNDQEVVPKKHKCTIGNCEKSFEKLEDFKRHIFDGHVPIRCDLCKQIFDCQRDMKKHIFECNIKSNPGNWKSL